MNSLTVIVSNCLIMVFEDSDMNGSEDIPVETERRRDDAFHRALTTPPMPKPKAKEGKETKDKPGQ
ncbi:hypothetical protein J0X15_19930 [Roseibium sp. CAU 1637]|uniref:Uncharacterized protein n=1 Tax=Roseibium limicola TaxID=2816037 RepID=A0A939J730_9HYPH|nr:hypothetical protein [Roseibium limicola]MBO0347510.1 hypothetical protein [Roseibium limicola]